MSRHHRKQSRPSDGLSVSAEDSSARAAGRQATAKPTDLGPSVNPEVYQQLATAERRAEATHALRQAIRGLTNLMLAALGLLVLAAAPTLLSVSLDQMFLAALIAPNVGYLVPWAVAEALEALIEGLRDHARANGRLRRRANGRLRRRWSLPFSIICLGWGLIAGLLATVITAVLGSTLSLPTLILMLLGMLLLPLGVLVLTGVGESLWIVFGAAIGIAAGKLLWLSLVGPR